MADWAHPLAQTRQLLEIIEVVCSLLSVHIVGGGGGIEARCDSPGIERVAGGQGGKGNAVV